MATTQQVLEFYGVSMNTLQSTIEDNFEELESDGSLVFSKKEMLELLCSPKENITNLQGKSIVKFSDGSEVMVANRGMRLFPKRAILRVGMLLRDSEVAKDVCDILEHSNSRQALLRLDSDEKGSVSLNDAIGRERLTPIINQSGLYSLIMSSRKPEAKQFKRWVTHEVLPSIKKNGAYVFHWSSNAYRSSQCTREPEEVLLIHMGVSAS